MCLPKAPNIPAPPPPQQEVKLPDTLDRKKKSPTNGTLLTGPSGIENNQMNLGGSGGGGTLLGG